MGCNDVDLHLVEQLALPLYDLRQVFERLVHLQGEGRRGVYHMVSKQLHSHTAAAALLQTTLRLSHLHHASRNIVNGGLPLVQEGLCQVHLLQL